MKETSSAKEQIRNLLIVLGISLTVGCLVVFSMLTFYNKNGHYRINQILLSSEVANSLKGSYTFDRITYTEWDPIQKRVKSTNVQLDRYAQFYALIKDLQNIDLSIVKANEIFDDSKRSELTLFVRADKEKVSNVPLFQVVQIQNEGNYFRVELRLDGIPESKKWAYFYFPDISRKASSLFNSARDIP